MTAWANIMNFFLCRIGRTIADYPGEQLFFAKVLVFPRIFRFLDVKVFGIVYTTGMVGIVGDLYETFDQNQIWGKGRIRTG